MGLRVLDEIISLATEVQRVVAAVRPRNRELADQLERAWCRVATGAGEAGARRGEKGRNRFDDALGEAKEAHIALRYAAACRYADVDDALLRRVDGVAAVLYRLAQRRR
jgi:four helix bundle protein